MRAEGAAPSPRASAGLALSWCRDRLRAAVGGPVEDAVRFATTAHCSVDDATKSLVLVNRSATAVRTPQLLVFSEPFRHPHVPDPLLVDGRRGSMVMIDRALRIRVTLGERGVEPGGRIELPIRVRPIETAAPVALDPRGFPDSRPSGALHAALALAVRTVGVDGRSHPVRFAGSSALTTYCAAPGGCAGVVADSRAGAGWTPDAIAPRHARTTRRRSPSRCSV